MAEKIDHETCGIASPRRLDRVSRYPHVYPHVRLERSADISRANDCQRRRLGAHADQFGWLGIERRKTGRRRCALACRFEKEAGPTLGCGQPGGGRVEAK